MKRNFMIAVLFAGIILVGHWGVTRASKHNPDNLTNKGSAELSAGQGFGGQELIQAENERSQIGLAISPVPVNAGFGKTRFLIGLGSYLVNAAGGCNDCHTNPSYATGGNPFLGQPTKVNTTNFLAGGSKFGPFTSRNITPDPKEGNLPAGMTLEVFIRTMRTGEDHDKLHLQISPLLQVMPWPVYAKMSDRDLQAMYLYLSAIPHAEPAP